MNFKKTALAAALGSVALGASSVASAVDQIYTGTLNFFPPGATAPAFTDTGVTGIIDFDTPGGSFTNGAPFFGFNWTADVVASFTAGAGQNWSTTTAAGSVSYNFTLTGSQVAIGVLFDWAGTPNPDIPVLIGWDAATGVVSALDLDGDGTPGVPMQAGPFPGQTAAFSGLLTPVPVPAAVWLFGSGLVGLVGVARRRKAA